MHVLLIPGLWLDAATWDPVLQALQEAGHRTHPLTLPGMESPDADRSGIGLRDHVDAVVAEIDALDRADGPVALVAHSAGGAVAHAAVDARPDRVARAVYVASEPLAAGHCVNDGFSVVDGSIPLPDWSDFDDAELAGLDAGLRAAFRERAIPSPARVATDLQQLSDERRYDVPITVIACECTSSDLKGWVAGGYPRLQELSAIRDVTYVDLPTSHWPQLTRPADLARLLVEAVGPA